MLLAVAVAATAVSCGDDEPAADSARSTSALATSTTAAVVATDTIAPVSTATTSPRSTIDGSVQRTFRPADDGAVVALAVGESVELILPAGAASPVVDGTAVELIVLASFAPSGELEFEIRGRQQGQAVVRGSSPPFTITFVVTIA